MRRFRKALREAQKAFKHAYGRVAYNHRPDIIYSYDAETSDRVRKRSRSVVSKLPK